MSDSQDARLERRLRLGIRLIFYPLAIGLIVLAWQRTHPHAVAFRPTPQVQRTHVQPQVVRWIGATGQDEPVQAATVDGVLTYLQTNIVTHCLDGSSWTLSLTMFAGEFQRTGDIVDGRQGPALTTSYQGEPVRVATRVRTSLHHTPVGTILSEITRSPGPHSVYCSSYELDYALSRATNRQLGELGATCPVVPRCVQPGICRPYEPTAQNDKAPYVEGFRQWVVAGLRRAPPGC